MAKLRVFDSYPIIRLVGPVLDAPPVVRLRIALVRARQMLFGPRRAPEWPDQILLETASRCNNTCAFCPVNAHEDPRAFALMPDEMIDRILAELGAAGYAGRIALYNNNEPLMDRRLEDICGRVRHAVPRAKVVLFTNGLVLTPDRYRRLFEAGLDILYINNYDDQLRPIRRVRDLMDWLAADPDPKLAGYARRTVLRMRLKTEVLHNRGGQAPNRRDRTIDLGNLSCWRPFSQLAVLYDGRVAVCCSDPFGTNTVGDLGIQSVAEIWRGARLEEARRALSTTGRAALEPCRGCDAETQVITSDDLHRLGQVVARVRRTAAR